MGYYISIIDSENFKVRKEHFEAIHKAFVELNNHDELKSGGSYGAEREYWFSWMPKDYSDLTTPQILAELGFEFSEAPNGDLVGFFYDNKCGDEDVFLAALAPFMADGEYLTWKGEDDGDYYRISYYGGKALVSRGEVNISWTAPEPLGKKQFINIGEYKVHDLNKILNEGRVA